MSQPKKVIITTGNGRQAKTGDTVTVHYVGTLETGEQFDSSRDREKPFVVKIGLGNVIKAWDELIVGMSVGEKAVLTCPYAYAYGERGYPPVIPQKANLTFEVELLGIN